MRKASMRRDLDEAMADVRLSGARRARILQAAEAGVQPPRPHRGRVALVALAACVVLAASALALSPDLREALSLRLGGYEPYSSRPEQEISCTDQGVRVKLVSTLADRSGGSVYLELTDLEGDRFDESMPCLSYDPETHTALVEKRIYLHWEDRHGDTAVSRGGQELGEDSLYTIKLRNIPTSEELEVEGVTLPEDAVLDRTLETVSLGERGNAGREELALVPNQTPMALEGTDLFTLSSVGFDKNGAFHVQLALADGVYFNEGGTIFCGVSGATEELVSYTPNILEGGRYIDLYYHDLRFAKPSDVEVGELTAYLSRKPDIEGEWELTFPLDLLPEREVAMDETIAGMPGLTIKSMVFSVMGARLVGETNGLPNGGTLTNLPAWLYLADGSTVPLENGSGGWYRILEAEDRGRFDGEYSLNAPVEPEQIVGVSLGYWMIPIQGDSGGPGHWITELPE